jgi:hypothetical protein
MNELAEASERLSEAEARQLTEQLRGALHGVYELMVRVYQGRAWEALGYSTWLDYCQTEFAQLNLQPSKSDRHEVVMSMREAGMSVRAISAATELGRGTVQREISSTEDAGVPNGTRGMDGKSYAASAAQRSAEPEDKDVLDDEVMELDAALDQDAGAFGIGMLSPSIPAKSTVPVPAADFEPLLRALSQTCQEGKRVLAGGNLSRFTHEDLIRETAQALVTMAGVLDSVNFGAAEIGTKSRKEVVTAPDCAVTTLDQLVQELGTNGNSQS